MNKSRKDGVRRRRRRDDSAAVQIDDNEKVSIVFSFLATCEHYRPWYWANFKQMNKQSAFRTLWIAAISQYEPEQIRQGLRDWADEFGDSKPPTPDDFAEYIRPKHTPASRQAFSDMKSVLK